MSSRPVASLEETQRLLRELNLSPNKSLGQNFLISAAVAKKIEQAVQFSASPNVLEIGPGLGALSECLAREACSLTLLELDARLYLHLLRCYQDKPGVEVINADAFSFDYAAHAANKGWREYTLAANLPYSITSPLIRHILLKGGPWRKMVLMVQHEVAQKLVSSASAKAGGPLALLLQYFGAAKLLFKVPRENFFPEPQVESAVIQVERWAKPPVAVTKVEDFERFLNAAFSHRRKTLVNSLSGYLDVKTSFWQQALREAGVAENRRAEELTLHEYGLLFAQPQVREFFTPAEN